MYLNNNKKLEFQKLNLLTFSSATASAIKNENLSLITFDTLTVKFSNNSADYGGAIFASAGSTVSFIDSNVTFTQNSAGLGGAIYASSNAKLNIDGTATFSNNTAVGGTYSVGGGGAIYLDNSALNIEGFATFSSNTASSGGYGYGGAISLLSNSELNIKGTATFSSNTTQVGGAIYLRYSAKLNIEGFATFSSNTADLYGLGGAIFAAYLTELHIEGITTFLSNTAGSGGAIYAESGSTTSFTNSIVSFVDNSASGDLGWAITGGGAIYNWKSAVSFVNSTVNFSYNNAYESGGAGGFGGAIFSSHSITSFTNSTVDFSANSARDGGAIYNYDESTVSFVNATVNFSANSAYESGGAGGFGGAIFSSNSITSFTNSTVSFSGDQANGSGNNDGRGGAIYNDNSRLVFNNSNATFSANTAGTNGGAIHNDRSTASFAHSIVNFTGNSAKENGGAIYNIDSLVVFDNSSATFLNNTATTNGGIFYNLRSTVSFINSTVFFLNDQKPTKSGISNTDSFLSFNNSTAIFINTISDTMGGEYLIDHSQLVFNNSTAVFINTISDTRGGEYLIDHSQLVFNNSTATFDNSKVTFRNNSAGTSGGTIFNDVNSTLIFKGGSKVVFEGNTATEGAGIYNNGTIEIADRSEVILRSGINGDANAGGVINIKSGGVLTISANEIVISSLNVWAGSKFSLAANSKANGNNSMISGFTRSLDSDFEEPLYSSKTATIDNLTVEGILEIGVDLSSDNRNDLISAKSITFLPGAYLNIVPFNAWESTKTYSNIFNIPSGGELTGFDNLGYNPSFFALAYDEDTGMWSLDVISNPYQVDDSLPDFIKMVFAANTIRQLSKFDDSSICENANENYWGVAQIGSAELKDSDEGKFGTETTGLKAGAALINKKNLKAGVYAGYDFGESSQKADKAEFSAFQVGIYASLLSGNINFKALSAYQGTTVKAKNNDFSSDFGINNINFGLSAELQTGKILTPYISLVGSSISSDEISQGTEDFTLAIDAKSYFTLTSKTGVQVKTKAKSVTLRAKGFLGAVLIGNNPEFDLTLTDKATKKTITGSAIPSSEQPLFFGIEGGFDLPLTQQIALAINAQTNFNPDSLAYQASVGVKYSFFGGRSARNDREQKGNERERKGTTGNDNGELPPAKQKAGEQQTATANDRGQGLGVSREPAEQNGGQAATTPSAGGQEQGTYMATFDTNSSDLSQNARLTIRNIAQSLSGKRYTAVRVRGFASDSANESANRTLAGQRAMAVARELVKNGVDRTKIKIEGYGSRNPRFPTDTPEGRARNQRVEIVVS